MQNPKFDTIVKQADSLLYSATEELNSSEDDFVNYNACKDSRESIRKYLTSFLLKKHVEPIEPVTLASLLKQCRAIDDRFKAINMSCILCQHDTEYDNYCLSVEKVNPCVKVAEQTRNVVLS